MKTTTVVRLLDSAKAAEGSDAKVAARLGVSPQLLSNWRGGRKNAQPEDAALLAWIAGLDAGAWLKRAMIEKHLDSKKGLLIANALECKEKMQGVPPSGSGSIAAQPKQ